MVDESVLVSSLSRSTYDKRSITRTFFATSLRYVPRLDVVATSQLVKQLGSVGLVFRVVRAAARVIADICERTLGTGATMASVWVGVDQGAASQGYEERRTPSLEEPRLREGSRTLCIQYVYTRLVARPDFPTPPYGVRGMEYAQPSLHTVAPHHCTVLVLFARSEKNVVEPQVFIRRPSTIRGTPRIANDS